MELTKEELAKFQAELTGLLVKYNVELYPNITIGVKKHMDAPIMLEKSPIIEEAKTTEPTA